MKPHPYIPQSNKQSTTSTWGLIALLAFSAGILAWIMMLTSCSTLESIPFSVSYTDPDGETFTITKLPQPKIHPTK